MIETKDQAIAARITKSKSTLYEQALKHYGMRKSTHLQNAVDELIERMILEQQAKRIAKEQGRS